MGGDGDDWVVGGKDQDTLFGQTGDDIVYGNLGNDTCDGGAGSDLVRGGQGNDIVTGGAGNDWLSGDRGDDTVTGGAGADIFHGSQDAGIDRFTDFNAAEGDRVMFDPGTTYTLRQTGADTVIDMGGGHQMVLVGVQLSSLPSGWILGT
jgi:Ca2+-binding RTX toxin-like protein